jgi:hypothetical protein
MRYTVISLRIQWGTGAHGYIASSMQPVVLKDEQVPPAPKIFNSNSDIFKSLGFKIYNDGIRLVTSGVSFLFIPETHPYFNMPLLSVKLYNKFFNTFHLIDIIKQMVGQEEYTRLGG